MTERRVALVTGSTGQDGAYLADLLLTKGYEVHGVARRCSTSNTVRIAEYQSQPARYPQFHLHNGDVTDGMAMGRLIQQIRPTELYNLAAQSHVGVSFDLPEYTANVDALGPLRILEAICAAGLQNSCRFYQASTSELYGQAVQVPQYESTPFQPRSPYGVAKLYGHWITRNYREAHGVHATNGILFNHESPLRGEAFVSRKISRGVAAIRHGRSDRLVLGNLDARRDWGHARDYVRAMWLMLQQPEPDDYVVATGEEHRVRDLVEWAFAEIGVAIGWDGEGAAERGYCLGTGRFLVAVDPSLFRPAEVDRLLGDPTKARTRLGWRHETGARALISEMVQADLAALGPLPPLLTSVASAA